MLQEIQDVNRYVQAKIRAAPRLTYQMMHPRNGNQYASVAMAFFNEITIAALKKYFLSKNFTVTFLHISHV